MDAPNYIGNAVSEYSMVKKDILPGLPDIPSAYDKLSIVVVALNERAGSSDAFINMMNTLLSPTKPYTDKKRELETQYHINMDNGFGREVNLMCNLSEKVAEIGTERGIEQMISNALITTKSIKQTALILRVDEHEVERIAKEKEIPVNDFVDTI